MPADPLVPSLAPGQRLELQGTRNTRDIGGYRTVDGATVRRGVVFRSDGLDHLTDADTDLLLGAGVRAILDFRSAAEASRPGPMTERLGAAGVARRNLPLFDEADARSLFQTPLEPGVHPLEPYYRSILVRHAANVRTALELLAEPANRPAIVHCSAGKDRTGVIVALLLSLAGVPASTICEDYARTGEFRGTYHVLLGVMDPMAGVGHEDIKIRELVVRLQHEPIEEVIVCTGNNTEGDVTAAYISRILHPIGISVTRIASGLPVGSDLEFADEITLGRALENRRAIGN